MDEGRFGLKTWLRRRWCPRGERPAWVVDDQYEWLWLYAAVEPRTGTSVFLLMPQVDSVCFDIFLKTLQATFGDRATGVVLDNAPSHHSQQVHWPEQLSPIYLPAYSPELSPVEQVFRHLRKVLAGHVFESLDEMEAANTQVLHTLWAQPRILVQWTNYPWWNDTIGTLPS